jgi:hypothetical protein
MGCRGTGSAVPVIAPGGGVGALSFPVSHGLPSLHRHRAPASWCRSPLGADLGA